MERTLAPTCNFTQCLDARHVTEADHCFKVYVSLRPAGMILVPWCPTQPLLQCSVLDASAISGSSKHVSISAAAQAYHSTGTSLPKGVTSVICLQKQLTFSSGSDSTPQMASDIADITTELVELRQSLQQLNDACSWLWGAWEQTDWEVATEFASSHNISVRQLMLQQGASPYARMPPNKTQRRTLHGSASEGRTPRSWLA